MSVQRRDFRREIVNRLIEADTPAEDRVFATRILPVFNDNIESILPMILVYTLVDRRTVFNNQPRIYDVVTDLEIQIASPMLEVGLDDVLDVFSGLVDRIVLEDPQLGGLVDEIFSTGSRMQTVNYGEKEFAGVILSYDVAYQFRMPDQITDQDLYDLKSVYTTYRLGLGQAPEDMTQSSVTGLDE